MNSLQFRQLAKLVEDLGKRLEGLSQRLDKLEERRGPGRPPKKVEQPMKVNDA